ncbi:methyltransferase domain-containing protein, partial [archaeon]
AAMERYFDGLHHIIIGGSFISTGNEASVHSRFHFRPHFHQHASFRLVEGGSALTSDTDAPPPFVGSYPFRRSQKEMLRVQEERTREMEMQNKQAALAFHFLPSPLALLSPAQTLFEHIKQSLGAKLARSSRVLEVGCEQGGLSLQLASVSKSVIGVDHNMLAVSFAKDLVARICSDTKPTLSVTLRSEGGQGAEQVVALPTLQEGGMVDFRCADPMCLPAEMMDFDVVVVNDVLDQLASPNALLGRLGGVRGLVKGGGHLVVISAYQWSEEKTPKTLWLGDSGNSEKELIARLASDFHHVKSVQLPLVWHETQQQLKGKVVTMTVFARK